MGKISCLKCEDTVAFSEADGSIELKISRIQEKYPTKIKQDGSVIFKCRKCSSILELQNGKLKLDQKAMGMDILEMHNRKAEGARKST